MLVPIFYDIFIHYSLFPLKLNIIIPPWTFCFKSTEMVRVTFLEGAEGSGGERAGKGREGKGNGGESPATVIISKSRHLCHHVSVRCNEMI